MISGMRTESKAGYGVRHRGMDNGVWNMGYGTLNIEYEARNMEYGLWSMERDV